MLAGHANSTAARLFNGRLPAIEPHDENLGDKVIEGVVPKASATRRYGPPARRTTQETWFSDLQDNVLQIFTDPRNGEGVQKLAKVDRAEPDPALFHPPADYKIVDEEGSFTITLRRPH